jgi:transposase
MKTTKQKYSLDFKIKAVELSNHRGQLKAVADELHIARDNLRRWKREYAAGQLTISGKVKPLKSKEELENIALRKSLRDAEMERDILKKALGIFSKKDA